MENKFKLKDFELFLWKKDTFDFTGIHWEDKYISNLDNLLPTFFRLSLLRRVNIPQIIYSLKFILPKFI